MVELDVVMDSRARDSYKKILDTVNNLIKNSKSNVNNFAYQILDDGEITIRLQVAGILVICYIRAIKKGRPGKATPNH